MSDITQILLYVVLILTVVALAFILGVNHEQRRNRHGR